MKIPIQTIDVLSDTLVGHSGATDVVVSELPNVESAVDSYLSPIVSVFYSLVFSEISIGDISFPIVIAWLLLGGVVFTVYFGFVQFRSFRIAFEVVSGKYSSKNDPGEVTHFQALASALSGTVGLGNIAGVGAAMALGGPGATLWMIVAGLVGMASKFVECTLGVKYRHIDTDGVVTGGPFTYLPIAFRRLSKPIATVLTSVYAIAILLFGFAGGGLFQTNQAFAQVKNVTGGDGGPFGSPMASMVFGLFFAGLVGLVVIGGIKSIANVTDKLVPAMAIIYVVSCSIVLFGNAESILPAFEQIFEGAFNPRGVAGGMFGVMIVGFQRAALSNEAGAGTASIAHSAVKTRRPVSEGFVALLEPFIDTVVICTMTALTVIIANQPSFAEARTSYAQDQTAPDGVTLVSDAFSSIASWWPILLAIAVLLFAFSTLITWAYYGLKAWHFLFGRHRITDVVYRILIMVSIVVGAMAAFGQVIDFADAALYMCTFVHVVGLYILMPVVKKEMKKFLADRRAGTLHDLGADSEEQLAKIRSRRKQY